MYPREAVVEEGVSDPNSAVLTHLCRGDSVTVSGQEVIPGLDDSGVYPSFPLQCEELGQVEGLGANVDWWNGGWWRVPTQGSQFDECVFVDREILQEACPRPS